jgi:mismatch-specific thymine-DNA glycosylase
MASQRRSPRFATASAARSNAPESESASDERYSAKRRRVQSSDRDKASNAAETSTSEEQANDDSGSEVAAPRLKKKRSTPKERAAQDPHSPINNLVDSMRSGLTLVMIGLNPGLMTAATGHAYAHPSNRFWHILHASGITPKKHLPSETRDLMDLYQIGNTNICARPTRSGDGLTKQEMEEGAAILDKKIAEFRPQAVVIVGKSIWEAIWMKKKGQKRFKDPGFHWGWQDEEMQLGRIVDGKDVVWPGAKTFVATSTSGLAATMKPAEKLEVWKPLGEWMTARRKEAESTPDHAT